jgi:alginate O-acetyltransferase complex protein AlgI
LFFFGYADFFIETANIVFRTSIEKTGYPLPVGITVYTLQTMSYVIDVYHGRQKAARNLLEYASFVTMFPQLSAGPIVSYRDMEEPLRSRRMNLHQISKGAKRICVGLAKKVLIADVAGQLWEEVMTQQSSEMSVAMAWLGILAFAFRIYFSFSGYADMAIGLGNCMGFSLPENFDHPYIATSVTDFFRRWNMTLIKWMKTYFFKPLAGERKSLLWQIFMVFVTWGLIGLWYGPDWTFVLWGFWLALFYILEKLFLGKLLEYFPSILRWAYAMLVVAIGLLLLALDDVADAWAYLQVAFGVGARGLWNYEFGALLLQYLPTMVLGVYFSMPLADAAIKKLEQGKNGMSIAITRFLEKVYPGLLLLISLVYLVGRGW